MNTVVQAELGRHPDELFADFQREPMAAASLGQVHTARLGDGREVVVKVQYPGIEKALENDLANAAVLVRGFALTGQALDGRPYYEELRASLLRELDYVQEAAQADAYRIAAQRYPELVVPAVVYERSSRRVLCLERIRGKPLLDFMDSDATAEERFRVARLLIFAIWGPFYAARLVHADPHPGNFFVLPGDRLGVLDFGSTKVLSERFAGVYRVFLDENAAGRAHPDVGPMLKKAGFRFLGDDEEEAFEFCQRIADIVQRPIQSETYDFGSEALFWEVKRAFRSDPRTGFTIKPPPEALLFYRSAAGVAQDLRLLKAAGPRPRRAEGDSAARQRVVKPAAVDRPQQLVDKPEQLAACVDDVSRSSRVGLDTESNGFHAYFEKVCLLQVATPDADWAIDTLALPISPLLPLLADPRRECILHAAEYDVLCMKRDYGLSFGRIFDTHAAAKTLGLEKFGLHDLLAEQLGVALAIDEQRSDWGKRPLSAEQLEYAFADVRYLLPLREKLGDELASRSLITEAEAEFGRLVAKEPRAREFDPEGWQRMKAARILDGRGRAVLRELYLLRDQRARELNRPAFKVLSDLFLAETARRLPKSEDELVRIPGTSPMALKKIGAQVLAAVRAGMAAEPLARPRPGGDGRWRKGAPQAPSPEVEDRYERLRAWRRVRAEARKVEVQVIAPNAVLWAIARANPPDLDALSRVEGMDPFRLEQYGPSILEALQSGSGQQKLI